MASKTSTKSKAKGSQSETDSKSPAKKIGSKTAAKRTPTSGKSRSTPPKRSSEPLAKAARKAGSKTADLQAQLRLLTEKIASLENKIQGVDTAFQSPSTPTEIRPPAPAIRHQKAIPVYEVKEVDSTTYKSRGCRASSALDSDNTQSNFSCELLNRARNQWLMGDWEHLGSLDPSVISNSSDQKKLLLLVGCAALKSGNIQNFKRLLPASKAAGVFNELQKALLASTFTNLARVAQLNGSLAKTQRFELHAITEMYKIETLKGLCLPDQQQMLDSVSQKNLNTLNTLERRNKFAEMEIESLRSQVESLKARAISQPASSAPSASATESAPKRPAEKKYYGLNGLDQKLELFLDFDNGYFVELGANDGVNQSNTFYFEQSRGWKGVLIEPVLHNFIKCKAARSPENFFQCAACVGFDYKEETLRLHYSNLMTTPAGISTDCPDPEAQARGGYQYIPAHERDIVIHAPARTLQSILLEAQAPRVIDLLSLDVEGGEMEVLKGIDHSRFQFRFLLVECRRIDQLQEFLAPKGYSLVEKLSFHDYLFQLKAP